jgi:hypothetical protein
VCAVSGAESEQQQETEKETEEKEKIIFASLGSSSAGTPVEQSKKSTHRASLCSLSFTSSAGTFETLVETKTFDEIVKFRERDKIFIVFSRTESVHPQEQRGIYLHKLKDHYASGQDNINELEAEFPIWEPYNTLIKLVDRRSESAGGVGLTARKGAIKLLLKFFLRLADNIIAKPRLDDAFEFAQDCLWLSENTGKNICAAFIERYMLGDLTELDNKTNLTDDDLTWLREKFGDAPCDKGKNANLIAFLTAPQQLRRVQHEHYAVLFCKEMTPTIQGRLDELLGEGVAKLAPSKTAPRILQKYEEYCAEFLTPGMHAYKNFKDLFRASITIDKIKEVVDTTKLTIADFKVRKEGNYRAGYLVLNIDTLNVEIKVVKSLEDDSRSHLWYELRRNDSVENVKLFIQNHMDEFVKVV